MRLCRLITKPDSYSISARSCGNQSRGQRIVRVSPVKVPENTRRAQPVLLGKIDERMGGDVEFIIEDLARDYPLMTPRSSIKSFFEGVAWLFREFGFEAVEGFVSRWIFVGDGE